MLARRTFQSILGLVLCGFAFGWLGGFYAAPAAVATLVAMSTGVYMLLAVAAGLVWPVLAVAFVMHVTRDVRLRAAQRAPGHEPRRGATGEPGVLGVEDP